MRSPRRFIRRLALLVIAGALVAGCGRSPEDLARYAALHHAQGAHVEAIATWTEALEASPDSPALLLGRARSYLESHQLDAARSDLERCLSLVPEFDEASFLLARTERESGNWEAALTRLARLRETEPTRAAREIGSVRRDRGLDTLRQVLDDTAASAPRHVDALWLSVARLELGEACAYLREPGHADELALLEPRVERAAADLEAARAAFEEAARGADAAARHATCDLAELEMLSGHNAAADERLVQLLRQTTAGDDADDITVRALRLRAEAAERSRDLASAVARLGEAIDRVPDDLDLRFARAMLLLKTGDVEAARVDAERVATDRYRGVQSALLAGIVKLQSGDANGAVADFQVVAANSAGSPISHLWLGLGLLATTDDVDAAMAAFAAAVEIDPRFTIGHLARAAGALRAEWWDVAVQHARRATELEPGAAAGWLVLGEALVRRGTAGGGGRRRDADFREAAIALGQALQLDPGGFAGQEALIMRNVVTGRLADGVSALRDALRESRDPELLVTLGEILFADQRDAEAETFLTEAVRLAPSSARPALVLAAALEERGRDRDAVQVLQAAISAGEPTGAVAYALVEHHARRGHGDEARTTLESALARLPDDVPLLRLRLDLAFSRGDVKTALDTALRGLRVGPAARPFHQAGALAAVDGRMSEAGPLLDASLARFPDDGALLAARALVAAALGEREAALTAARAVPNKAPRDVYLTAAACIAMHGAGDAEGARGVALTARSLPPAARAALEEHVRHAESSDDVAALLRDLHLRQLALGPGGPGAPLSRTVERALEVARQGTRDVLLLDIVGNALLARGNAADAAELYAAVLEARPDLRMVREKLALIRVHAGDAPAALDALGALFQNGAASARAHALAGALLDDRGDLAGAARHLGRALDLAPGNAEVAARLAHVNERLGRDIAARDLWERALSSDPGHAVANARLAERLSIAQPERADTLARRAVAIAPRAAFARRALATVLIAAGDRVAGRAELEKALAIDPDDARTWELQGLALFADGDTAQAKTSFQRAIALDDTSAIAHLQLAIVADRGGQADAARAGYERTLELDPKNVLAANNLADALRRQGGDLVRARELAELAVKLSGGRAEMLDTLGSVLLELGETSAACAAFARAVTSSPDDLAMRFRLARALRSAGRDVECRRELELLEALDVDFPGRAEARTMLAEVRNR